MLETAFFTLASQVVSDICLETGKEKGTGAISWVGQAIDGRFQELIYNWSKRYVENYAKRHGILKVLGMSEPVDLDSIYTKVCLLSDRDVYQFASVDGLEAAFRETRKFRQSKNEEKPIGLDVANEEQYLMVLGAPGAGKSTLLRKIGLEALKGKNGDYQHQRIPVFLELKRFNQADIDIVSVIAKEFEICKHPHPREYAEAALDDGKLVILFDGLDEVPTEFQNGVINAIEDFVDQYDKNRFVASCRVAAYNKKFRQFRDVAIADFDDSQIEQFIQNWFRAEQDQEMATGQKCWALLKSDKHRGAKELARTPLLLTFLCFVYDRSQTFPKNRSQLYNKALRILLEEWAASKRLSQEIVIYEGLHTALEEELLADIAYWGFEQDKLFFQKWELVEEIQTFLAENLNAPKSLNGEAVLNAIAVQQGIFVERAVDIYSFSHLTLQEYLTAKYIVNNQLIEQSVEKHITDSRWKEVFILVAGLAKGRAGADPLLLAIEQYVLNYTKTPTGQKILLPWMEWAIHQVVENHHLLLPYEIRLVAINFAYCSACAYIFTEKNFPEMSLGFNRFTYYLNTYKKAIIMASVNNERAALQYSIEFCRKAISSAKLFKNIDFLRELKEFQRIQQEISEESLTQLKIRPELSRQLAKKWLKIFNFPEKSIQCNKSEITRIQKEYLYPYNLMLDCKDAAIRVSPSTWQAIEDRIFLPPEE